MRSRVDGLLSPRLHVTVRTRDGQKGFALFGGWKARHQFQRLYLGTRDQLPTRVSVHRAITAEACRALARQCGMVVFCGSSAPADLRDELLSLPVMLDVERDTPRSCDTSDLAPSGGAREDLRRVRKYQFTYDVVQGDDWVDEFYERMFRPTMLQRHGAEAYIDSRRELRQHARAPGAELLRVFDRGAWVAGSVNRALAHGYRLLKTGWILDEHLMRRAVVGAIYTFNMTRAATLGSARILFGAVAPFLDDGLLQYKTKWGARLSDDTRTYGDFSLLLDPSHPACRQFVRRHSMIVRGTSGGLVVLSAETPDALHVRPQVLKGLSRWYTWQDEPKGSASDQPADLPRTLRPWLSDDAFGLAVTRTQSDGK